jgi:hypothetical protein
MNLRSTRKVSEKRSPCGNAGNHRKASVRRLPMVPEVVAVVLAASSFVGQLDELRSTRKVS